MGAVDKLLNFMKLTEDEEYDEYDEYEEEEEEPDTERRSFFRKKDTVREESNVIEPITYTSRETKDPKPRRFGSGKVVSMNGHGVEVYVIKPQDFAEAQTAAVAQRSIDFVGGATYAIDGSLQAVSNNIFIAAPDSIEVNGDLRSEIMNENIISPQLK